MTRAEEIAQLKVDLAEYLALIKHQTGYNVQIVDLGTKFQVKLTMTSTKTIYDHEELLRVRYFLMMLAGVQLG